jgi:hypothetical protein
MNAKIAKILTKATDFTTLLENERQEYLHNPKAFTRVRILCFKTICFCLLCQSKRTLATELDAYLKAMGKKPCTKGAFSKARYKIKWQAFQAWLEHIVRLIYAQSPKLARWKGFRLKAIDGSSIYLFEAEGIEEEFGGQDNQHGRIPMARAGLEVDVLNGFCTQARLQPYSEGESVFAFEFLKNSSPDDLCIYDRLFPSFELIFKHLEKGVHFLMRCKLSFNKTVKQFVSSGELEAGVEFSIPENLVSSLRAQGYAVTPKSTVKVRLLRIDIGQSEPEILITSLQCKNKYPHSCFKELYGYRWGVETKFDTLKNKFQIEVFSGHKPEAVYQDFFATIIAANLHTLLVRGCDQKLEGINAPRQSPVAIHQNVSIGLLKARMAALLNAKRKGPLIREIIELFLRHVERVRRGIARPRSKTARRLKGKYQTFKNYRRTY